MSDTDIPTIEEALGQVVPTSQAGGGATPSPSSGSDETKPPDSTVPNPIAEISVEDLLKDPTVKGKFQSYIDKAVAAQLQGKTRQVREQLYPQIQAEVEEQVLRQYFGSMSKEEIASTLAENPELAATYGRLQQQPAPTSDADIDRRVQIHSYAQVIRSTHSRLLNSDLDETTKASLAPEGFLTDGRGEEGLRAWTEAIDKAIVEAAVGKATVAQLEERWESFKQDKLAEEEKSTPGMILARGTRQSPVPDLMENDSDWLLEEALKEASRK